MSTDSNQASATLSPLTAGGLKIADLPTALASQGVQAKKGTDKFWSSSARPISAQHVEVLDLRLGAKRNVNHIDFDVSRFPLNLTIEWQDKNGNWNPLRHYQEDISSKPDLSPRHDIPGSPVRVLITNSVPHRITHQRTDTGHPQHYGKRHWLKERWKVNPVSTDRIRFRIERNHKGNAPVDSAGNPVAYSVALRNVKIGFKVEGPNDLPKGGGDIGSGTDLLDSSVLYSVYQQGPERAIDGNPSTAWLCEPQPINYAVVNYVLDTRDANGDPEVIDSFYVDPLTPGVHLNLYHSDEDPIGDFLGSSDPVPALFRTEVGNPISYTPNGQPDVVWQEYGPDLQTGLGINAGFTRLDLLEPWWVGIDMHELGALDDPDEHPILSLAGHMLSRDGSNLLFTFQSGDVITIPLDPLIHVTGQRCRLVLAYVPATEDQDANVRLVYGVSGYDKVIASLATKQFTDDSASIRVGLHPSPSSDLIAAMALHGLVVKTEVWTEDAEDWFLTDGADYVADTVWETDDLQTNANALFRIHPQWISLTNIFGIVGGDDERLSTEVVWTPVPRDYTLRKGYIHIPPTRAKYWKFEFTQLAPHVYEASQTILRTVQVFPASVIALHAQIGASATSAASDGPVSSTGDPTALQTYNEALNLLRTLGDTTNTPADASALIISNPQQAADVASVGWIWQWQPWHTGALSPGWPVPSVHTYETIPLRHSAKVAYFVGLKEVQAFRTDYSALDDTPEYVEHFLDDEYMLDSTGITLYSDGIQSDSAYATFESKTLNSYQTIRGVQFATVQTGKVEVLTDPTFVDPDLSHFYAPYGDAHVQWISEGQVQVQRGFIANTYGDLESFTYAGLEAETYGQMEGGLAPGGRTEGGIQTQPYTPIGQGRLDAKVWVSADTAIGPVTVEIVSYETGEVLSENTVTLKPGVTTEIDTEFTAESITDWQTYGDLEAFTYAEMEASTYGGLEATIDNDTRVFVRVRQAGGTQDTFNIYKIGLYADPIVWSFSVDGGSTWWPALDVKNDPHGVVMFPVVGNALRWKAEIYRPNSTISALHVRPWYGDRNATAHPAHDLDSLGANQSVYDQFPDLYDHPIWKSRDPLVEQIYVLPVAHEQWRNLYPNPGNETPPDSDV